MEIKHLNPECVQGKHENCDGQAWDDWVDDLCECQCSCHTARD